jgi:hypothetical protein
MHYIAKASAVIVMASFILISAFTPGSVAAADDQANSITIEIVGWSTGHCNCVYDVQFRISTDLDNDGSFEVVNTSQISFGVERVNEPLKANIAVPSDQTTFAFKVEAIRVDGSSPGPLYYGVNESGIVHQGANIPGFDSSWEYNYPRDQLANASTCSLSYRYEVAGQGSNDAIDPAADGLKPMGSGSPFFGDPVVLGAVGLLSAAGGAGAMKIANARSGQPGEPKTQNDEDGPDAPDNPDSPTCPGCNNSMLKDGDFCHHCGARKPEE